MRHGLVRGIGGRKDCSPDPGAGAPVDGAPEVDCSAGDVGPAGGWWGPLTRVLRSAVALESGVVNLERERYQLGEWVRRGPAMAAFTVDADGPDDVPPADRVRRHLELNVVVRHAVELAGPAFSTDGVDWVYPRGHSCRTGIYTGAVEAACLAGFLERVAEQVGEVAGSGSIAGAMSAYANADAIYLVRSVRC